MKKFFTTTLSLTLMFAVLGLSDVCWAQTDWKIVDSEKVCMVTDMFFGKKQIPVPHDGVTYYGCCEHCKNALATDPKVRTAKDPVSGQNVNKARAVIAANSENGVLYFESAENFQKFQKKTTNK